MPMNKRLTFAALFVSFNAVAEVSDKMATNPELWLQGFIFVIPVYFLTVWRKGFLGLGILFTVFFAYVAYATLSDPYIGVGIIKEQGRPYIIASYSAAVIIALCSALGLIKNKAKSKEVKHQSAEKIKEYLTSKKMNTAQHKFKKLKKNPRLFFSDMYKNIFNNP